IAVYFVLKSVGLTQSLFALILVYSAGGGLSFYITKGFFDTVPRALDEAARIDGANNAQIFFRIILPLSKPIIVYTVLTTFIAPWVDFIFAKVIMGDNYAKYTVAVGLYTMLGREFIDLYFTRFAAGAVCIAVPITILFIALQRYYVEGITGGAVKG
ncbi:MAG: ABC transporter permease subunit, partial [Clostridia bacterium]|nr:ABC transporter permease subunit [Clostridia bacterium]